MLFLVSSVFGDVAMMTVNEDRSRHRSSDQQEAASAAAAADDRAANEPRGIRSASAAGTANGTGNGTQQRSSGVGNAKQSTSDADAIDAIDAIDDAEDDDHRGQQLFGRMSMNSWTHSKAGLARRSRYALICPYSCFLRPRVPFPATASNNPLRMCTRLTGSDISDAYSAFSLSRRANDEEHVHTKFACEYPVLLHQLPPDVSLSTRALFRQHAEFKQ